MGVLSECCGGTVGEALTPVSEEGGETTTGHVEPRVCV